VPFPAEPAEPGRTGSTWRRTVHGSVARGSRRAWGALVARLGVPLLAVAALTGAADCARRDGGRYVVGFAQMDTDSRWRQVQTHSLEEEAARRGIDLVVTVAQGRTAKQIADVQSLIARHVDVILLAPREYEGLNSALQAAKAAKIPVILVDREAAGIPGEDYVTFLGSNFAEQGRRAAEWLARATGGQARIVELTLTPGSSVTRDRAAGFRERIARYPGMQLIASQTAYGSRDTAERVMGQLLQSLGPRITAVYAHNDEMAIGALKALKAAGRQPGQDVLVASIDGLREALEAIEAGEMGVTIESSPRFGPLAFATIEKLRRGEHIPPKIIFQDRIFDRSNAARFIAEAF
jgi:ribose transport system substrate-binding protein